MKTEGLKLYRRRYIPDELIQLTGVRDDRPDAHNDEILHFDGHQLVTHWKVLHPRTDFAGGTSAFFLDNGWKVSRITDIEGNVLYWYCDIVDFVIDEAGNSITYEDLLFDVIVYPNGKVRIMDCDEAAEAFEKGMITSAQLTYALRTMHELLEVIYHARFDRLQSVIESYL